MLACLLSDILDGLIARIFHLRSRLGAILDSTADMIVFAIGMVGLFLFQKPVLVEHRTPLALAVALYLIEAVGALWRYHRISSFHTILVRISAYAQGIFVMSLFFWGYLPGILYPMTVISAVAYLEEIVLLVLLPEWKADVRGLYWVISQQRTGAL
jgi:CDP-diacylglycerol--glycerol-3-phosphate 3-phosphatidyltransferase